MLARTDVTVAIKSRRAACIDACKQSMADNKFISTYYFDVVTQHTRVPLTTVCRWSAIVQTADKADALVHNTNVAQHQDCSER
jgi:hypothetical protein